MFNFTCPPGSHIVGAMNHDAQLPGRLPFHLFLAGILVLSGGCGKPSESSKSQAAVTTNAASTPAPAEVAGPGPGEKVCFACKGEGLISCGAPGCVGGKVDCPGPCLKLSRGVWKHLDMPGHAPSDVWQVFRNQVTGKGGKAWSQVHVGEVIEYQNNEPVNIGKCKICGGTGKVKCEVCKGTGQVSCPICEGKKFIPVAWTPTDNPYFNRQPDVIRLADGRVLLGRVAAEAGDDRTIVTRDKKTVHVNVSDMLPASGSNAPAAPASPAK
jgi:hypothetical protein